MSDTPTSHRQRQSASAGTKLPERSPKAGTPRERKASAPKGLGERRANPSQNPILSNNSMLLRKTDNADKNAFREIVNKGGRTGKPSEPDDQFKEKAPPLEADFGDATLDQSPATDVTGLLRPIPSADKLSAFLESLGISTESAKHTAPLICRFLAQHELVSAEIKEGPDSAPCMYIDRPKGMTPPQFIKHYYANWLVTENGKPGKMGQLTRRHLRTIDEKAALALYKWEARHPNDPDLEDLSLPNLKQVLNQSRPEIPKDIELEVIRQRSARVRANKNS